MQKILAKREKLILYITVAVIIFSIVFNFLLAPLLNKYSNLNKEINLIRMKLKKYLLLLSQKDYIQNKYNKFVSGVNLSEINKDAIVSVFSELEALTKGANIQIIDIRPEGPSKSLGAYKEILIDLRAQGSIEGYLKFIYDLQNSLSLLKITRFQITAKPNTPLLEGSFSISQVSLE